ncbi:MAG: ABC transporter, ATP-binding protein (cluster 10, nitrate/sulfonate/bicarbonate), partial [uncultured Thermomicrobiales bacterium]
GGSGGAGARRQGVWDGARDRPGPARCPIADRGRRIRGDPRSQWLRQIDPPAPDRRSGTAVVRRGAARGGRGDDGRSPLRHRLPGAAAASLAHGHGQRRARRAANRRPAGAGRLARTRRLNGVRRGPPTPALGRHGAARGARPRADRPPGGPPPRRTLRLARRAHPDADAGSPPRRLPAGAPHRGAGHARRRRGHLSRRPDRRHGPAPGRGRRDGCRSFAPPARPGRQCARPPAGGHPRALRLHPPRARRPGRRPRPGIAARV